MSDDTNNAPAASAERAEAVKVDEPVRVQGKVKVKRRSLLRRLMSKVVMFLALLALLVIVGVVATWAVLRTSLPQGIVTGTIGSITKTTAEAESISIGLMGDVSVTNLTARLPTEDEPFLRIDEAQLKLPPLPVLAFGYLTGKPEVQQVQASGVHLFVRELPDGRYNLQQVAANMTANPSPPSSNTGGGPLPIALPLPTVDVSDVNVTVRPLDGEAASLTGIALSGRSLDRLLYDFEVTVPEGRLLVDGQLVPAGTFSHEIAARSDRSLLEPLAPVLSLPVEDPRFDVSIKGDWDRGYTGRVVVASAGLGTPAGAVEVAAAELDVTAATPDGPLVRVEVALADTVLPQLGATAVKNGVLSVSQEDGTLIEVDNLLAETLGGKVVVSRARFDPAELSGTLSAKVEDVSKAGVDLASATAEGTVGIDPLDGSFAATLTGRVDGAASGQELEADYSLTAAGPSPQELTIEGALRDVDAEVRGEDADADVVKLSAFVDLTSPETTAEEADGEPQTSYPYVALRTLRVQDDLLDVTGELRRDGGWDVQGSSDGLSLEIPRLPEDRNEITPTGRFTLNGSLVPEEKGLPVNIETFELFASGLKVDINGAAHVGPGTGQADDEAAAETAGDVAEGLAVAETDAPAEVPGPLMSLLGAMPFELTVKVAPIAGDVRGDVSDEDPARDRPIRGDVTADLTISGEANPLQVTLAGTASGENVTVGDTVLETFGGEIDGSLDPAGLNVATTNVRAFGGIHELTVDWPLPETDAEGNVTKEAAPLTARYVGQDVNLAQLADLAGFDVAGTVTRIEVDASAETLDVGKLRTRGRIDIAPTEGDELLAYGKEVAEAAEVTFTSEGTELFVDRAALLKGDGELAATARLDVADLDPIRLTVAGDDYRLKLYDQEHRVNLFIDKVESEDLVLSGFGDAPLPRVKGRVATITRLEVHREFKELFVEDVGELRLDLVANDDVLELETLDLNFYTGGRITGQGQILANDPARSELTVSGTEIDFNELFGRLTGQRGEPDTPAAKEDGDLFDGVLTFDLDVGPQQAGSRDGGDIRFALTADGQELRYQGVGFDSAEVLGTIDLDEQAETLLSLAAIEKLKTQKARLATAGGVISAFLRIEQREVEDAEGTRSVYLGTQANIALGRDDYGPDGSGTSAGDAQFAGDAPLDVIEVLQAVNATPDFKAKGELRGRIRVGGDLSAFFAGSADPAADGPVATTADKLRNITTDGTIELAELTTELNLGNIKVDFDDRLGRGTIAFQGATVMRDGVATQAVEARNIDLTTNGVNVRGQATIAGLLDPTGRRPIDGTVIVLARPLDEIKLPFVSNAGGFLDALQSASGVNAYRIGGTINDPEVRLRSLDDVGRGVTNLLRQDAAGQ